MKTKVATHTVPEWHDFVSNAEENAYWDTICSICHNNTCEDDCMFAIRGDKLCEDCMGDGIVCFIHRPDNEKPYKIITQCGMCDGIGLV